VQNVHVEVEDVELLGHAADFVQHDEMIRNGVPHVGIETKSPFAADLKSSGGDRVAAGKKGYIMALPDTNQR
jgi:hypothetical protein